MKLDIVSALYGLEPGGAEISTRLLVKELVERGVDVQVVSSRRQASREPNGVTLPEVEPVPWQVILYAPNRLLDSLFRRAFIRRWLERKPDVVLIEDHLSIVGAVEAVEWLRRRGQSIVLAMTQMWEVDSEFFFRYRPWPIAAAFVHRFNVANGLAKRMDFVNGVTPYIRRRILERLRVDPARCEIIHTVGLPETMKFPPVEPARPLLMAPGRINPEKGSLFFFNVVKELARRRRDFDAVFLGGGPYEKTLREMISREGLDDVCRVTGKIPYEEFLRYYGSATAIAIPIMYPSAYTRVVLESLQAGKPVITFDHGSMPDVVIDCMTGFRTNPHDVAAFADACEKFVEHPELTSKMAADCKRVAREHADIHGAAARLIDVLKRLLLTPELEPV